MAIKSLIGSLIIDMALNTARFKSGIKTSSRSIKQFQRQAKRDLKTIRRSFAELSSKAKVAGVVIAGALVLMGRSIINAASTMEDYQTRLVALLSSQKEGNRLFKEMTEFAGKVPFEFEEIMGAATQLAGVMSGGVDEVKRWMPLIGDLAAVTGLSIEDTTGQIIRMYSAGAASADLFRERGVLAMLGFQAGVSVSAEETRKQLIKAFEDPASKFRGSTQGLAKNWTGLMSMMGDSWFALKTKLASAGILEFAKQSVKQITDGIRDLNKQLEEKAAIDSFRDAFLDAMKKSGRAVGAVADGIFSLDVGFKVLEVAVTGFTTLAIFRIDELNQALIEFFKGFPILGEQLIADKALRLWAKDAVENLKKVNAELVTLTEKAWPSEKINAFFDKTIKKTKEAMTATGEMSAGMQAFINQFHVERKTLLEQEKKIVTDVIQSEKQARMDAATEAAALSKFQTNTFIGGFQKTANEFDKNQRLMAQAGAATASALQGSFSNDFFNVFTGETKTMGDLFNNITQSMKTAFLRAVSEMIAKALILRIAMAAATGGGSEVGGFLASIFHEGGEVGSSSAPKRKVSASTFTGARRMHSGGLAGDEVPVILQKGEVVIPKDETGGAMRFEFPIIIAGQEIDRIVWERTRRGQMRVHTKALYDPAAA